MNIESVTIYQYNLNFIHPIFIRGLELKKRQGLILRLISDEGQEGFGEIAPLTGFSKENLAESTEQITSLKPFLLDAPIPEDLKLLGGKFNEWLEGHNLNSSVRFGVEMAILDLLAKQSEQTLNVLLAETPHHHIRMNGLLQGDKELVVNQTNTLIEDGYKTLKLKVGKDIDRDIEKVRAVAKCINGRALLHLDANQSWELEDAVKFAEAIGLAAVDYIEEPFKDVQLIPEFFMKTTIPVALDESLIDMKFENVRSIDGVDVLILKPTILGGIERVWDIMSNAKQAAIDTIISSSYESSIGILTLANLAGSALRDRAAGLDTLKYFDESLLFEYLPIDRGKMDIENRFIKSDNIHFELLTELAV